MAAYQAALAGQPRVEVGAGRTKPGNVNALVISYFKSNAFTKALGPGTQRMRRNILEYFRTDHGDKRAAVLERRHIIKITENKTPAAQKNWLKTIRGLMLFAIADNSRTDDPSFGIKATKPQVKSRVVGQFEMWLNTIWRCHHKALCQQAGRHFGEMARQYSDN